MTWKDDDDHYEDCLSDWRHEQDGDAEERAHLDGRCLSICDYCISEREREEAQKRDDEL